MKFITKSISGTATAFARRVAALHHKVRNNSMTIVPLSVSMRALYFFFGSICIAGGFVHCLAIIVFSLCCSRCLPWTVVRTVQGTGHLVLGQVSGGTLFVSPAVEARVT